MMDYGCFWSVHPWSIFNSGRKTSACLGWPESRAWLGPYCSNTLRTVESWDYPTCSIVAQDLKYFVCVPSRTPWAGRCGWQAGTRRGVSAAAGLLRAGLRANQNSELEPAFRVVVKGIVTGEVEHLMAPRGTFCLVPLSKQ